jgi:hypothetical protein
MERTRLIDTSRILDVLASGLPEKERHLRARLIASRMHGVAMIRYVGRVGALATLSPGDVSTLMTSIIQRYLTGLLHE